MQYYIVKKDYDGKYYTDKVELDLMENFQDARDILYVDGLERSKEE